MKTDDFITVLAHDGVTGWRMERLVALAALGATLFAAALFLAVIGVRADFLTAVESARVLFKFALTLTLAIGGVGLLMRIGRPDMRFGRWTWLFAVALLVFGAGVAAELLTTPQNVWLAHLIGRRARFCLTSIPLLALAPLAVMLLALRHGAPRHPGGAGALAGLSAAAIAAAIYAMNCTDDSPLFVATWYSLATALVVLAGYLAGSRLLRW